MPRCEECSGVEVPRYYEDYPISVRTWDSGLELIRLSEAGCDLCCFIRRHIEKVSEKNVSRIKEKPVVVLKDCHSSIHLEHYVFMSLHIYALEYRYLFAMEPAPIHTQFSDLKAPYNPVLRACELFEACVLDDNSEHGDCKPDRLALSTDGVSLPRRLLDLSHGDDIVTVDVQEWLGTARATVNELSNYCTLSYRWGDGPPDCMLSTQFTGERVISFPDMPQTFQDAIIVARALKIRFIWIDALCIIQPSACGDFTDWNTEGPRMWIVYQNAVCTIAATCSSDPENGFLRKVGTDYNAPCSIPDNKQTGTGQPMFFCPTTSTFYGAVTASSLNRRGWVAQERVLSRRILHFTEEGVFWECQAVDATTDSPAVHTEIGGKMGSQHVSRLTPKRWLNFIEFYSASEFTQLTDRLIALSSIANSVPIERFGKTYFAGIWMEHFWSCLSWRSEEPCSVSSRAPYLAIAPSWSWASVPGRIVYVDPEFIEPLETWVEVQEGWASSTQASNPYGSPKQGALKLLARLCIMPVSEYNICSVRHEFRRYMGVNLPHGEVIWDELQDHYTGKKTYTFVPLSTRYDDVMGAFRYKALVVTPLPSTGDENTGDSCRVYRRIGYFEWKCYWRDTKDEDHVVHKQPDIPSLFDKLFPNNTLQTIVLI